MLMLKYVRSGFRHLGKTNLLSTYIFNLEVKPQFRLFKKTAKNPPGLSKWVAVFHLEPRKFDLFACKLI